MDQLHKYPRTRHVEGSRIPLGDEDLEAAPFSELAGRPLVVEEKMDGANCAISFDAAGRLRLQSRGHYLSGGPREKHFTLFKRWAASVSGELWERLHERYVVYGEWLYAKHTVFYDRLPHYFLEFDVLDTETGDSLSTPRRRELLADLPIIPVRVLAERALKNADQLDELVGSSAFIGTGHLERLSEECRRLEIDADRVLRETDRTALMEGLYIKVEEGGVVTGRYKFVRASFLTAVLKAEGHWLNRPIVPNLLCEGADLFAGAGP